MALPASVSSCAQWLCSHPSPAFCPHTWSDRTTGAGMVVSWTTWPLQVIDMGVYAVATLTEPQQLHQVSCVQLSGTSCF